MEIDETNKIVFIDSERRPKSILLRGGFKYNFEKENKSGSRNFRCSNRLLCSTSITLDKNDKVIRESNHSCQPEFMRREVDVHINVLKRKVCENLGPVQPIYENTLQDLVEECDAEFDFSFIPSWKKHKTCLYNARNKSLGVGKCTFKTLEEVVVPDVLSENFLICNDGSSDKILIFASSAALDVMSKETEYFGDGTFKVAPPPFLQLYILLANVNKSPEKTCFVPIIYALLPNKEERTYKRLFSILKHRFALDVKKYKCDFEIATINGLQAEHPGVMVSGCYFHFKKALWRRAKQLGLVETEEGRVYTKLCTRLALLPKEAIPGAYMEIAESLSNWNPIVQFHNYFMDFWMRKITSSLFCVSEEEFRTNNAVEGWNNRINHRIPKKPSVFQFIKLLRAEAQLQDVVIRKMQLHCPDVTRVRRINISRYRQERNIVNDYVEGRITVVECLSRLCQLS